MQDTKSIQKLLVFVYTNNEKSEKEIRESTPFTIATKRIKYLGINLPKDAKELYTENCDTDERNHVSWIHISPSVYVIFDFFH